MCGKDFARQDKLKLHKRTSHVEEDTFTDYQSKDYETTVLEEDVPMVRNTLIIPKVLLLDL